jgi:hypothetical protein
MPPTPGLLWAASIITRPDILTPSSFESWYNTEHIPDIFKTSAIRTAIRYRNIDPSASRQYLAIYPVPDVNWLGTKEFLDIPVTNKEIFKTENGKCFDCADFDTRFYEWVHGFEGEGAKPGIYPTCLLPISKLSNLAEEEQPNANKQKRTSKPDHLSSPNTCPRHRRRFRRLVQRRALPNLSRMQRLCSNSKIQTENSSHGKGCTHLFGTP